MTLRDSRQLELVFVDGPSHAAPDASPVAHQQGKRTWSSDRSTISPPKQNAAQSAYRHHLRSITAIHADFGRSAHVHAAAASLRGTPSLSNPGAGANRTPRNHDPPSCQAPNDLVSIADEALNKEFLQ